MNTLPRFEICLKDGLRLTFVPQREALVIEIETQQGAEPVRMVLVDNLLDDFLTVLSALKREGH